MVEQSDIIFVPIQTPHEERYEGTTRLPDERKDFIYRWLVDGIRELSNEIAAVGQDRIVVIISTVLPGTMRKHIFPILNKHVKICYNPFFIAMGTTMKDFLFPEFVLLGVRDEDAAKRVEEFYKTMHQRAGLPDQHRERRAIKVAYNTYISMKITFANTWMEICHNIPGTDVDAVTDALALATTPHHEPQVPQGGMGDGGGCHPRDNIALSWLARELDLSYDFFESIMMARERRPNGSPNLWRATILRMANGCSRSSSASPSSARRTSPSAARRFCSRTFSRSGATTWRCTIRTSTPARPFPAIRASIFLVGTNHPEFTKFQFPTGSIVLDPWRHIRRRPASRSSALGTSRPRSRTLRGER